MKSRVRAMANLAVRVPPQNLPLSIANQRYMCKSLVRSVRINQAAASTGVSEFHTDTCGVYHEIQRFAHP